MRWCMLDTAQTSYMVTTCQLQACVELRITAAWSSCIDLCHLDAKLGCSRFGDAACSSCNARITSTQQAQWYSPIVGPSYGLVGNPCRHGRILPTNTSTD